MAARARSCWKDEQEECLAAVECMCNAFASLLGCDTNSRSCRESTDTCRKHDCHLSKESIWMSDQQNVRCHDYHCMALISEQLKHP